jgi:hypothetical protein
LNGIDVVELYVFNGSIKDKKIWGDPPYENSLKTYLLLEAVETVVSSPLFDGRYSFDLFRYHDDEDWQELGNGFVEIINGEVIIEKDNSELKTGSKDLYDTFSGQINKKGKVSGSVELAYLVGIDHTEVFTFNGQVDEKIWGDSPREDFFRVYMLLEAVETVVSSPLFDGRYSFDVFRYSDDESDRKVGSGFVDISNGEVIIEKGNRELKTGSTDLYDTFSGQINKEGKVSASMELDVLNGKDAPEFYEFNGSIKDKKIWGETAYENSFKAYMLLVKE